MHAFDGRTFRTEVKAKAVVASSAKVAEQVFESLPVHVTGFGHELAQLVDHERDVGASPAGKEIGQGNEAGILGGAGSRRRRAVFLGEDSVRTAIGTGLQS